MEDLEMLTTPPALKWLAEKRARVAGDIVRTEDVVAESTARLEKLRADLAALDQTIRVYDSRVAPDGIEPVRARVTYGRRGALRTFVAEQLEAGFPAWLPTNHIERLVIERFGLTFASPTARKLWYDNSLKSALKDLVYRGVAEREQDPDVATGKVGRWRWKAAAPSSLAALRAAAPTPVEAEA